MCIAIISLLDQNCFKCRVYSIFYKALQIYFFFKDGTCVHLLKLTQAVKSSVQVRLISTYLTIQGLNILMDELVFIQLHTVTSKEFIKCSILNFLMMECCRYFLVDYMELFSTFPACSWLFYFYS